jgi:hypothetical protein
LFNIGHKKSDVDIGISKRAVTREELCAMILNLPKNVVIISKEKPADKNGPGSARKQVPAF